MFKRRREASPTFAALNEREVEWRDRQLSTCGFLAKRYCGVPADIVTTPQLLDDILVGWLDDTGTRVEPNMLINAVGIAFGALLAAECGLDWVIATDTGGSDLALLGQPGDITIYPANVVAKRVVTGQRGFVVPLLDLMRRDIYTRVEER